MVAASLRVSSSSESYDELIEAAGSAATTKKFYPAILLIGAVYYWHAGSSYHLHGLNGLAGSSF